jgi:hypothetical protein
LQFLPKIFSKNLLRGRSSWLEFEREVGFSPRSGHKSSELLLGSIKGIMEEIEIIRV